MDHLTDAPVANILILAGIIFLAVGLFGRIGGFIGSIFGNIEAGKNSRVLAGILGAVLIVGGGWLHEDSHKSAASGSSSATHAPAATSAPSASAPPSSPTAGIAPPSPTPEVAPKSPTAKASIPKPSPSRRLQAKAPDAPERTAELERLPASTPPPVGDDRLVGTWTNLIPRPDTIRKFEIVRDGQGMNLHLWYACPSGDCDVGYHRLDFSGSTPTYEYNNSGRRRVAYLTLQTPKVLHVRIDLFENGARYKQNHWVFTKSTIPESLRSAFATYLGAPGQKAFAMAPGVWSYQTGAASADDATQKAMLRCEKRGVAGCRIILLNDDAAK
jgi:hypothetical protein